MRAIVALLAMMVTTIDAHAYKVLLHPSCPAFDKTVSWRKYMSGTIPMTQAKRPLDRRVSGAVGVQFTKAKRVKDPKAIGNLATNRCYGVIYRRATWKMPLLPGIHGEKPKRKYKKFSYGTYESWFTSGDENNPVVSRHNLPGNPENWEINVQGVLLRFNDGGELLNKRGKVVGRLVCYFSEDCGRY